MVEIDAQGVHYRDLNQRVRRLIGQGKREFNLINVNGQRYIGDGLASSVRMEINGTPGNDLAAFASGVEITVHGNVQDGVANTLNDGRLIVHGHAGDILGYGMRGGQVYIKGKVGYRVGIHMKGYREQEPVIIIGGTAGDFLGEYMAGGKIILLGLNRIRDEALVGNHLAVGMHGGVIYLRGEVEPNKLGREVRPEKLGQDDWDDLERLLADYCREFDFSLKEIISADFWKLIPVSSRPYGKIYAY